MSDVASPLERVTQQILRDAQIAVEMLLHSSKPALFEVVLSEARLALVEMLTKQLITSKRRILILCSDQLSCDMLHHRLSLNIPDKSFSSFIVIMTLPNALKTTPSTDFLLSVDIEIQPQQLETLTSFSQKENKITLAHITAYAGDTEVLFYGEPIIKYSLYEAQNDDLFVATLAHQFDAFYKQQMKSPPNTINSLKLFFTDFLQRPYAKAIFQCPNKHEGGSIYEDLLDHLESSGIVIKPVSTSPTDFEFVDFRVQMADKNKSVIGVSHNKTTGIHEQTDLVILYHFSDMHDFITSIEPALIRTESKANLIVWDYGDNKKYYDLLQGTVIDHRTDATDTAKAIESPIIPSGDSAATKDMLGRGRLVRILKGLITFAGQSDGFRPFVIGLLGRWGTGKSTVINLLKDEFKNNEQPRFLEFNAWNNEHCSNMGAAMANSIVEQLYDTKSFHQRLLFSLLYNLRHDKENLLLTLFFTFTTVVTVAWGFVLFGNTNIVTGGVWTVIAALLSSIVTTASSYYNKPFAKKLRSLSKRPDYSYHLGLSEQIKKELICLLDVYSMDQWTELKRLLFWQPAQWSFKHVKRLFKWLLSYTNLVDERKPSDESDCNNTTESEPSTESNSTKFVLIVDDLDRCSDQKIMEVLESIRLLIDLESVVAILAVDQKMLLNAVATRYREQNQDLKSHEALIVARDFLGKIFQLTIELDIPDPMVMSRFVATRLYHRIRQTDDNSQIESIQKSISEARENTVYETAFAEAVNSKPSLFSSSYNYEEPEEGEVTRSDDYLTPEKEEQNQFATCLEYFSVTNPRTLVRLHNTVTLLKGMYLRLATEKSPELPMYIYLTFLIERYNAGKTAEKRAIENMFDIGNNEENADLSSSLIKIHTYGKKLKIFNQGDKELKKMISRISKHSLPSAFSLHEANTEENSSGEKTTV